MRSLGIGDADYPERLKSHPRPPERLWVEGSLTHGTCVAIVGSREPSEEARRYAGALAAAVAGAGATVVSGGAFGIDAAAHQGALSAGGVTWAVLPSGHDNAFPAEHKELFADIPKRGGATLSCVPPETPARLAAFHRRNGILVCIADVVVIVQAGLRSGSRNAASWGRKLKRPLWVVPTPPWSSAGFEGNALELEIGAIPLVSTARFLESLRLDAPKVLAQLELPRANFNENKVLSLLNGTTLHVDEIIERSGLGVGEVASALLTLALEDVVVEGPERCFRRMPGT